MNGSELLGGRFLFLRHGQTSSNAADVIGGTMDAPLSQAGEEQVRAAAAVLAGVPFSAVWTSALQRARQTADAVAVATERPVHVLPELGERNWGAWEGNPRSTLRREETPPGGESPQAFARRVETALSLITPPYPVLIVAHSGTARVLWDLLIPHRPFLRPANASLSEWRRADDGRWTCREIGLRSPRHPLVVSPT